MGLRIDAGWLYRTTVNVQSRTDGRYLCVVPVTPGRG